jgi:hypothetical protein
MDRQYTLFNHKRKEEILEEVKVESFDEKLRRYKSKLLRYVTGMNSNRMANIVLSYRRLEIPLKKLLDETEAGLSRSNR